jgi:hypothetical protein
MAWCTGSSHGLADQSGSRLALRWQEEPMMSLIGVCGDNCSYCPRYIATRSGKAEELEEVKELWVRLGFRDSAFHDQDLTCFGCKPKNPCAYSELRGCASEKGIDNCGLCDGYPCKRIDAAFKKSEELRSHATRVCTPKEMDALYKAFFSKRQNLDQIHREMSNAKIK